MYRRLLIATDGSKLSQKAITQGVAFAKAIGATVVGCHVRAPTPFVYYGEPVILSPETERGLERDAQALAAKYVGSIETAATKAGVPCKLVVPTGLSPSDTVIRTAQKEKCDLIVMASHGRKGISRVLLGSETNAVLTHSKIPVLVTR